MKNNRVTIGKVIYISAAVALIASFLVLVLEKSQIINLYSKPSNINLDRDLTINDVDYSPADPSDNESINDKKESGGFESNNNQQTVPGDPINVVLTAAAQDVPGGPVVVRVLLNNVSDGICNIKLSKSDLIKEYTLNVTNAGTYYNCDALDIPADELSAGEWDLLVEVNSGSRSGSANQKVEVKL